MQNTKLYIVGHTGMVGSAITRKYKAEGYTNIITRDFSGFDLTNQKEVDDFLKKKDRNK